MKSIQTTNTEQPEGFKKIGLFIECRKCNKGRTYKIDEQLKLVEDSISSGFNIEVECEGCKNVILVGIGYIDENNYSYKKQDFISKRGYQVLDENGLGDLK